MPGGRTLLLLVALLVPAMASPQAARKIRVAILDIRPLGTEAAKAELLSEVALTEAASLPGFDVIGKSDINALIGFEKQKRVIGCTDDSSCLAEIGGALGVEYILVGSLGTLGDLFRLDLKLVEVRKAKVRARIGITVEGKESKLVAAVQKGVHELLNPDTLKPEPAVVAQPKPQPAPVEVPPSPPAKVEAKPASLEVKPANLEAKPEKKVAAAEALPIAAPPPPPRSTEGSSAGGGISRRTWAYATGGAGVALLLGGAVVGLQARSALDKEKSASASGDLAGYNDNKSKVKSMSTIADVLFLGGAAGVGVGGWLFLTSGPAALALDVAPVPGGAVASISGGF
jgi:hypothetical protein